MIKREDVHCPSRINPVDYEYVGQECIKVEGIESALFITKMRERIKAHMAKTGGTYSGHEHGGECMVCGSINAIYTVLFYHAKTNSYVRMGSDCAEKCAVGNPEDFRKFRTEIKDALARAKGKAKAKAVLETAGHLRAWEIYNSGGIERREEAILRDIVGRLIQYGSLSEKQLAFLGKLAYQIDNRERIAKERAAKREAENAVAQPCPSGRVEIKGEVLCLKEQDSPYGPTLKMLVRTTEGWKCWGTVPSILQGEVKRGDKVYLWGTLTPSKDDAKFGFFSRPAGAEILH